MDDQNDLDIESELSAIDSEIHRLTQRRNELLALRRSSDGAMSPAAATSPATETTQATPSSTATKPDWYPDPFGRYTWRYRDERGWTSWVARNGVTSQDPPGIVTPSDTSTQWAPPSADSHGTPAAQVQATPTASAQPAQGQSVHDEPAEVVPSTPTVAKEPTFTRPVTPEPVRVKSEVDIGKLMLIIGAALVIGGIAGLTAWLWTRLPGIGRLALLGLASALQIVFAVRIRERLQAAAEAFAATGAATLLFATGSVAATATWDGTVGVVIGAVGIMLLLTARFRAWVIAGHLAITVGAIAVLVAEPWSQTALIIAVVIGVVRVTLMKASTAFRPSSLDVYPQALTATGLMSLLAAPALAVGQFEAYQAAIIFTLVAAGISEIATRTRDIRPDHEFALIAGAVAALGGVGWSAYLWSNGGRSDGLVAMSVTAVVAVLLWRASRTEATFSRWLTPVAVALLPVAGRFACDPASMRELAIFSVVAAVVGVGAIQFVGSGSSRSIDRLTLLWFWAGAAGASIAATEELAAWPRLGLATVALASVASVRKLDDLRYAAALTATLTVADLLYGDASSVTWWFRPDLVGLTSAVALFVVNKLQSTPRSVSVESWNLPRHWESVLALLAVPVVGVASSSALMDLSHESRVRLGLVVAFTVIAWVVGAVRRTPPNAAQMVSLLGVAVIAVSRVGDESAAVRSGAWVLIGVVATVVLMVLASVKKMDDLRFAAAGTATATVVVLLYGDLFELSWWFRPDVIGLSAAAFLLVANKMQSTPRSVSLGSWEVPRHWESAVALLVVPVVDVASSPALMDLPHESLWRMWFIVGFTAVVWGIGVLRRLRPNAAQLVSLLGVAVVVVSRVVDDSAKVRSGAWVVIGTAATIALAVMASFKKKDELRFAAAGTATLTVAVLLYGDLFELSWWFRPDLIGVAASLSLYVAIRTCIMPRSVSLGRWQIPRYWESAVALLVVPVVDVATRPALMDLPDNALWRLWFIVGFTAMAWLVGLVRRTRPNAAQVVSLLAMAVIAASRVGDESATVRSGAWVMIGCVATIALSALARIKKLDELRFAAAGTATLTVIVLLYGDLFELSWWFRPDLVGLAAAVALYVADRTCVTKRMVSLGTWEVPRYWESAIALLAVPVVDLVSQPAFFDLPAESVWRLGLLAALMAAAWAYGAMRRTRPDAIQIGTLAAVTAVIVSRVGDESLALQMTAWIGLGLAFMVGALLLRRVELIVPGVACWVVAVVVYGPPGPLETTTLSFAAIMAIGATLARRFGRRGSYDFIPASALVLVPSAFAAAGAVLDAAVDSEQVVRIAAVLVLGAVALAYGASKRLAALVGPSVVALVALAVAQLIVVQRHASGWVSALVAGVVLLTVGTRLEYLRTQSRRAADLVKSLR